MNSITKLNNFQTIISTEQQETQTVSEQIPAQTTNTGVAGIRDGFETLQSPNIDLTPTLTPLTTPISNEVASTTPIESVDAASVFDVLSINSNNTPPSAADMKTDDASVFNGPSLAVAGAKVVFETPVQEAINRMKREFKNDFQTFAADQERFHTIMNRIYVTGSYSREKTEQLRQRALSGDYSWLPRVRFVPDQAIGGKNGIYDSEGLPPTVYMSDRLLKDPVEAQKSFNRAVGFHLDHLTYDDEWGDRETEGIEGELFRAALADEPTNVEGSSVRTKDDPVVVIEGRLVQGEEV
jgi:hypothetical protein